MLLECADLNNITTLMFDFVPVSYTSFGTIDLGWDRQCHGGQFDWESVISSQSVYIRQQELSIQLFTPLYGSSASGPLLEIA